MEQYRQDIMEGQPQEEPGITSNGVPGLMKTRIPPPDDATVEAVLYSPEDVLYVLQSTEKGEVTVRVHNPSARTTIMQGGLDAAIKSITDCKDETVIPLAVTVKSVRYTKPQDCSVEEWDEILTGWGDTIHTPIMDIKPRMNNPEMKREVDVIIEARVFHRDRNNSPQSFTVTGRIEELPERILAATPVDHLIRDKHLAEIRNIIYAQLRARGLPVIEIVEAKKSGTPYRTIMIDYTTGTIIPYRGDEELIRKIYAAPLRIKRCLDTLQDGELLYEITWMTGTGETMSIGPATMEEHYTRLRDMGCHSLKFDEFHAKMIPILQAIGRYGILPEEATTSKPCIMYAEGQGLVMRPQPGKPGPDEVGAALELLEEIHSRFYNEGERERNFTTTLQYTLMMPYIWLAKTYLTHPRLYRYLYLYGEGGTGKSMLQRILSHLLPEDEDITVLIPAAGTDTAATLGDRISSHGYGVMIEDVSGIFTDEHLESMIKTAAEHTLARKRNRRQADGTMREKSYHSMSPIVFSSNTPLRHDQPLLRRFYTLTFTERPEENAVMEYDRFISEADMDVLRHIYEYGVHWNSKRDIMDVINGIPHGKIIPDQTLAESILLACYEYAGMKPPEWIQGGFRPYLAEDNMEPLVLDALITHFRDILTLARREEDRYMRRTTLAEEIDESAMMDDIELLNRSTEDVKLTHSKEGLEVLQVRHSIIPKINRVLRDMKVEYQVGGLNELLRDLERVGVPCTLRKVRWEDERPRVIEIPSMTVVSWLEDE